MDERTERIILVAMDLAERDGYDAVRLRDVAEQADVALGTVYRRFSCKEDILAGVLNLQVSGLRDTILSTPNPGETPEERLSLFFEQVTRLLADRPKLAAAMLRTVASGVPHLAERVTRYHDDMTGIILHVMRGDETARTDPPTDEELVLAHLLQNVWFASLVGWTGGLHDANDVVEQLKKGTRLLLRGMQSA
ncbi:MAG: TetR family transcriptional regulator [Myxococcota bacterium]|jgi:AcrR family transcriptional regulator|nr:TetR family transcriptional regulator [Myxococcota bacterium]